MMHHRVGGLAGQNATSTAQGRERHTGCTLHPDSARYFLLKLKRTSNESKVL